MAGKPIVIIHGWSDDSDSFQRLAARLGSTTGRATQAIWLGDYLSLDDDIRLDDLVDALQRAWLSRELPLAAGAVDVIVHSTGGLIIRAWIEKYFTGPDRRPPVGNLVMLAPANFGSPLAHKGRSIIGRVIKGAGSDRPFQTGEQLLKTLEMASPDTWRLAERDRFAPNPYRASDIRCTVLVGNSGFSGIKGLANDNGSDGTVYVATANLNCARLDVRVARDQQGTFEISAASTSQGLTAFRILDGFDHGEITGRESLPKRLFDPILSALTVNRNDFKRWADECEAANRQIREKYARTRRAAQHAFQNTVFHIRDDQGRDVPDYAVEFYGDFEDRRDRWARIFNGDVLAKVHPNGERPALRSFMIDCTRLARELDRDPMPLRMSLTAMPDLEDPRRRVGYRTFGVDDIGQLELDPQATKQLFAPDRTLFLRLTLPRYQRDEVFRFNRAP